MSTNAEWSNMKNRNRRAFKRNRMWLSLTDHICLFPALFQSVNTLKCWGNFRQKCKEAAIIRGRKKPKERDCESISRTANKSDPCNYSFRHLRAHGLGKIHQVISLSERRQHWKELETMEPLSGELWLHMNKPLSQRSNEHTSCEKENHYRVKILENNG